VRWSIRVERGPWVSLAVARREVAKSGVSELVKLVTQLLFLRFLLSFLLGPPKNQYPACQEQL
jgi:hypothetical protein